jgi:streptogramin lyase
MSTTTTSAQPPSSWYPNLSGLNLPRALTNGMQQAFSLLYSLRDSMTQAQQTTNRFVQYGTEKERTQTDAQSAPDGALWFDTDADGAGVYRVFQARLNPDTTTRQWVRVIVSVGP